MKIISQCALAILVLFAFTSTQSNNDPIKIGTEAPKTTMKMDATDGSSYSLKDLKMENGLLVIFSCNTCPFVVGSETFEGWERQYNDIAQMASSLKIGSVLVNSNEAKREGDDSMDAMKIRSTSQNYAMKYVLDKDNKLADEFGAKTTPHIFLFDQNMKLVYSGSIDNSWDSKRESTEEYLKTAMSELTEGKAITTQNTPQRGCSIKRK